MSIAPAPELSTAHPARMASLEDAIHVWILPAHDAATVAGKTQHDAWLELLSTDEIERAGRFHFAHHAAEFVANRGRLRCILGQYLEIEPKALTFTYSATGKPSLAAAYGDISFNLSHTEGLALLAVAREGQLGIDIEKSKPEQDALEVARHHFSPLEIKALESYSDATEREAAFLRCWTRKEAFLKALGDGLSRPLAEFSVSCGEEASALLDCGWDATAPACWRILSLNVGAGYTAALACEKRSSMHFPPEQQPIKIHTWSQE